MLVATEATLVTTFTDPQTGETVTDSLTAIFGAGNGDARATVRRILNRSGAWRIV